MVWNKDVRVIDVPVPDVTELDDVTYCQSDRDYYLRFGFAFVRVRFGTDFRGANRPDIVRYHGEILTMQEGDILGHEVSTFEQVNYSPTEFFQIACGECEYCK